MFSDPTISTWRKNTRVTKRRNHARIRYTTSPWYQEWPARREPLRRLVRCRGASEQGYSRISSSQGIADRNSTMPMTDTLISALEALDTVAPACDPEPRRLG